MRWSLLSAFCLVSVSAQALDATYLTMVEPKGFHCAHQASAWICAAGELSHPSALLELKSALLDPSTKMTMADAEATQRQGGTVNDENGHSARTELKYQHRVQMAGLDWTEAVKYNSGKVGMTTHQWVTVLPTQHGPFVISVTAGYSANAATMDKLATSAVRSIHLSQHVLDYVEYLSVPEGKRDAAVPQVAVGTKEGAKIPVCGANKKLEMTVGTGKMLAFPIRSTGVAVVENSRALEVIAAHVPYIMTTLLFSPMAEGKADVYVFDRTQKCRVHYAVAMQPDTTRVASAPHEWTKQTIRTPSSAAEADAEYARLGTAVVAGHLEAGNPVGAIPFPTDGTIWVSDPRVFDTVKLKPDKAHAVKLALIGKHPGTTTLVVLDPTGRGRGYKVTVDAHAMHLTPTAMGQYENEL